MASSSLLLALLVAACFALQGSAYHFFDDPTLAGAFPLDTADLKEVAANDLDAALVGAAAGEGSPNCSVSCNDESYGLMKSNKSGHGVSCWGTFKAFCKGHSEKACGFAGFKCEGHFLGFKAPCGAKLGTCFGESKKFAKAFIKTKSGLKIKVFKAGGGIGTHGVAIAPPNLTLPHSIEWPTELEAVKELYEGKLGHKGHNGKVHEHPIAEEEGPLTLKKAFGDGAGGGLMAVKKLTAEDEAKWSARHPEGTPKEEMTFAKLEEKADRKLAKLGYSLPVEPSYFNMDLGSLVGGHSVEGVDCSITCNGKPAWFHGGFPCFGFLKVDCTIETGKEKESASSPALASLEGVTITHKAGCKGFWSGVFGKKCMGFSYAKTGVKAIEKYAYCSGKKGIFGKKKHGAFVAGGSCFGKGLFAVQYTPEEETIVESS